jgi:hypothetical protein
MDKTRTGWIFFVAVILTSYSTAEERERATSKVITLVRNGSICRAWFLPKEPNEYSSHWKARQLPGDYVDELGLILLRGQLRLEELTLDDVCKSPSLTGLDLAQLDLKDQDLEPLKNCSALTELILTGNEISDAVCDILSHMTKLKLVNLHATNVSKGGIKELAANMPRAKIELNERNVLIVACDGYQQFNLNTDASKPRAEGPVERDRE